MLRDFKFLRSNAQKKEEAENVPIDPKDISAIRISSEPSRAPFNPIQEAAQPAKPEEEVGIRSRVEKTPTKASKAKVSDPTLPLRTPDKLGAGFSTRKRFGWAQKTEPSCTAIGDSYEDGRAGNGGLANVTPRVTRTVGRASSSYSESNSTQTTPTKSVSKPPNSGFRNKLDGSVGPRVGNFGTLYKGIPMSCGPSTVVNTVEVPHFDLKEDPSFWMDHNVQVLIRVRPLNGMERSLHGYSRCLKQESAQTISWIGQPESRFTFDHVACETVDQEMLFRMAGLPIVENCLSGYNSCMFAYGQTGSGKTYTMLGEIEDLETKPSPHRGMTPRIFEFLFARIQAEEEIRRDEKLKYNCKCSFLEIYNEQITDLLDPSSSNLHLREDVKNGVYVENLSEFEVCTVGDILRLLIQGSSNRKVAATNMNRESSRSHSVFTCVIESTWEKDSTTNLRYARLNLVDLAGSERQKTSGAEGERLKEAANINKSLSTLGHVIMVLVDMAQGKLKHVPYRDSRLTFLLQDSLGGNSKTMIIANVSPSICCAAETLNTLKFSQRAKLIQNNAVVNEDSTDDVIALQHQIRLLKEELYILKRHNVSRTLSFGSTNIEDSQKVRKFDCGGNVCEMDLECEDNFLENESKGTVRLSTKQLKSLETTLSGALRREQMAETTIKQLEAEREQLNRLVHQREEDTRGTKMMLRFREDKIQKMESLLNGSIPVETYLPDENRAQSEEIQLLKAKLDKNPEVTRFALENIRLLDQLRRFQEFYEEGEREILLDEISKLRDQLLLSLDGHSKQRSDPNFIMKPQETVSTNKDNDSLSLEVELSQLKNTLHELEECRRSLNTCSEENAKLQSEIDDLHTMLNNLKSTPLGQDGVVALKVHNAVHIEEMERKHDPFVKHAEEILNLQLELDIVNIILKEERKSQEESLIFLNRDLQLANEELSLIRNLHDDANICKLQEAKSVIEALESQQFLSINELEDLRNSNNHFVQLLSEKELELRALQEQRALKEFKDLSSLNFSSNNDPPLEGNLKRMQVSLERAKRLNTRYQSDRAYQVSNEVEMDEVRRQAEAETAEVIVCMQEELSMLQQQVQDSHLKEMEMIKKVMILETELKEVQANFCMLNKDNERLSKELEEKDGEVRILSEEWALLSTEIEEALSNGCEVLDDASDQLDLISNSFPQKRIWVSEQVERIARIISEKEFLIEELSNCLEEANNKKSEVECMLKSLRGATMVITESHEQECCEKEKKMLILTTELNTKTSTVEKLESKVQLLEAEIRKTSVCATAALIVVNRLAETNLCNEDGLRCHNIQLSESEDLISMKVAILSDQVTVIAEAEKKIQSLSGEIEEWERTCSDLRHKLSEEQERACIIEKKLEDVEKKSLLTTKDKLEELKTGVSTLKSCMNTHAEHHTSSERRISQVACKSSEGEGGGWIAMETILNKNGNRQFVQDLKADQFKCSPELGKNISAISEVPSKDVTGRDVTIILLKKEIEAALYSLQEVQAEMDKLREENKLMCKSEQQSHESMKNLRTEVLYLQSTMNDLEKQLKVKLEAHDHRLEAVQQIVQEAGSRWCQTKEVMETEFDEAKLVAAQKTAEVFCILAKFEEAQDIIKEADIMINELMISNETMKIEIKTLKKLEVTLIHDKDTLQNEVRILQSMNHMSKQQFSEIEELLASNIMETKALVVDLESMLAEVQANYNENFMLLASDFCSVKSLLSDFSKLVRSSLEGIWSEIIMKDCAVSVLHLCHMGIFLETVTGLNAENGLLQHGLCESSTIIADLRQHNIKSRRELEMCQILKGKLLADIKNSFDHSSRREEEAGKLHLKLKTFEKQLSELQFQEELMLQRSNYMGSQLAILMKEMDWSNSNYGASLLDQEKLLQGKEESLESQAECFMIDWLMKDFESLILTSELEEMAMHKADMEREWITCHSMIEDFKKEVVLSKVDGLLKEQSLLDLEVEAAHLLKEAEKKRQDLWSQLNESSSRIKSVNEVNKALEQDIQLLKTVALSNDSLQGELDEVKQTEVKLLNQVQILEAQNQELQDDLILNKKNLELSASQISDIGQENQRLKNDIRMLQTSSCRFQDALEKKYAELRRLNGLEMENESLKAEIGRLNTENSMALKSLEEKKSEFSSSVSRINVFDKENCRLQDEISSLETHIANLETRLWLKSAELDELEKSQSAIVEELCSKSQELQICISNTTTLKEENVLLREGLLSLKKSKDEFLTISNVNSKKFIDSVETVDLMSKRLRNILNEESFVIADKMVQEIYENGKRISEFIEQFECLEHHAKELGSENLSLQAELLRKDDILKGLLFDLSLLQESASNNKDQQDEIEEIASSLEALEDELSAKSCELDEAIVYNQMLEAQLQEKTDIMSTLELGILEECESLKLFSSENDELKANIEDALKARNSVEKELTERQKITESLKMELLEMSNALGRMNDSNESLRANMNELASEKDLLHIDMLKLKENLERQQARADEIEAIANEAQQISELRKMHGDEKEAEVKLLERSVEELERTIDVLENKVDIVKEETEQQRLHREELELELNTVKHQMQNVEKANANMKRFLDEKEQTLKEALQNIHILENDIAQKDGEIAQFKAHISELNLHAEAQACEYKQKFKALEFMAEQVKPDGHSTHATSSSSSKSEKQAIKSRGSGSPFKCIGLGLAQQIKSEKDEEFTAARVRIEELESLAISRQKEIFTLNARLATAESMTHDVIRDLLGVKLDMTTYVTLLDNQQVQKITEKARLHGVESQEKEQEVVKLKKQLNEFIQERQGWLEEIDRKQAELISVQIALEKLKQRDQLLKTENEMLKVENVNHKKKVIELEGEVNKLSGQQNLHQRIHHHAKIKEENHKLKVQNEELSTKVLRTEVILSRVKEELASFHASSGRNFYVGFDEEQRLSSKLKEIEEEKLQLAQKFLGLCTSVLKAAGITKPSTQINPSAAEEALEQLKNKVTSMDKEMQDLKLKNKISSERIRLSELMPQTSPRSSRTDEKCQTPKRMSQAPYFSALDR